MSTESILTMATIDEHSGRDVSICDIPGAFLIADMDKDVKMALCGILVELMVNIAPKIYRQHIIYKKGRPVLYLTLKKPIYGYLRLSLLFYDWIVA